MLARPHTFASAAVIAGAAAIFAGCAASDDADDPTIEVEEEAPATPAAPAVQVAGPDTTGTAIWAHLQESEYDQAWQLWPDKGRNYPGQQPHGAQLTTLLNDVAYAALMDGASEFPNGSIVVKQNFTPDGTLAAVTTMYKVTGYNAEHADWFFTKHLPDGSPDKGPNGGDLVGRVNGCQSCHIAKADNDYIFTGELGS